MTNPLYIPDFVRQNAASAPNKLALVCADKTFTWRELSSYMESSAALLAPRLPQDHQAVVGVLLPNGWQFVVTYLAILETGHIIMPFDPTFKVLENMSIIEQIEPAVVITNDDLSAMFDSSAQLLMVEEVLLTEAKSVKNTKTTYSPKYLRLPPAEQVASLLFTSGTTGKPKATPYTHANHLWNIQAVTKLWKWTAKDTILMSLPLSHWHGLVMGLCGGIRNKNTIYVHERFDAEATLTALSSGDISLFMHVPIAYFKMVEFGEMSGRADKFNIGKVRLCVSGSSYLPPAIWQKFKNFYGQDILERYGASEMGLLASNKLDERIAGSVGYVLPDVNVRIEKDGQIAMRSPGLFPGYYKNDAASAEHRTKDGWWLSGDIGEFADPKDPHSRLVLKGRIQEKMKKHGYTVYPRDVEWAVLKNPGVHDMVVMSLQQKDELSDKFVYFVVADLSEDELLAYSKEHLPAAWRPDIIVILDEIPKTRSGKPVLRALREMVE